MNYKNLELKENNSFVTVQLPNGKEINVTQYLPIADKIDLIDITLQQAEDDSGYNEAKLDMFFALNIVFLYTDITFEPEDKEDLHKLYDELESNDVINSIISGMAENEYETLRDYLNQTRDRNIKYKLSAVALMESFIQDMPKNAEAAADILNSFDPEKYKEVIAFAKTANAGRPIDNKVIQMNKD